MKKTINEKYISQIRCDFPIFDNNPSLVYFDNAASSQIPRIVVEKMNDYYYNYKANVGRTSGKIAVKSDNAVENIRTQIAKFLGTQSSQIIWTSGSTESLNLAALSLYKYFKKIEIESRNTKKNGKLNLEKMEKKQQSSVQIKNNKNNLDKSCNPNHLLTNSNSIINKELNNFLNFEAKSEVIITQIEHHSNFLVWPQYFKPVFWEIRENTFWWQDLRALINKNTKILAITQVSNFTGQILPIKEIIKKIRTISPDICVILDGSQAVLNLEIDLEDLGCDFYCFSGHKILAPNGIGVLWAKEKWLKILETPKFGGGMVNQVGFLGFFENESENQFKKLQPNVGETRQNKQQLIQNSTQNSPNPCKNDKQNSILKIQNEISKTNQRQIQPTWQPYPHSWEAGTPNITGIIGLGAAIEYFKNLEKTYNLTKYKNELWEYLKTKIEQIPGICVINPVIIDSVFWQNNNFQKITKQLTNQNSNQNIQTLKQTQKISNLVSKEVSKKIQKTQISNFQVPILTFYHIQINSFDLSSLLSSFNICLRSGSLCCQPFAVNLPTNSVLRVSLNFYNTKAEIDFFVIKLVQVIEILN